MIVDYMNRRAEEEGLSREECYRLSKVYSGSFRDRYVFEILDIEDEYPDPSDEARMKIFEFFLEDFKKN